MKRPMKPRDTSACCRGKPRVRPSLLEQEAEGEHKVRPCTYRMLFGLARGHKEKRKLQIDPAADHVLITQRSQSILIKPRPAERPKEQQHRDIPIRPPIL